MLSVALQVPVVVPSLKLLYALVQLRVVMLVALLLLRLTPLVPSVVRYCAWSSRCCYPLWYLSCCCGTWCCWSRWWVAVCCTFAAGATPTGPSRAPCRDHSADDASVLEVWGGQCVLGAGLGYYQHNALRPVHAGERDEEARPVHDLRRAGADGVPGKSKNPA